MSYELLHRFVGLSRVQVALNAEVNLNAERQNELDNAVQRLLKNEPIQHITGNVEFYGLSFKTDHRALIPRPETEELVDWIVRENSKPGLNILDIGTGTGCIAISLAKNMPDANVAAIDVSDEAIALATDNALLNRVEVNFLHQDILEQLLDKTYDLIVSNPPYIPHNDKINMSANVLNYEPATALFVPDDDPLLFYRRIGELAIQKLSTGGSLYFEIHEAYGHEVRELLMDLGFGTVVLKKDLQGKDRMIKARKP